jgi:hypothetical protein
MPRDRDAESGKYTDAFSDEDFIEAIHAEGGLAGTTAVAEIVGCTRRQALNRLKELREQDKVTSKDVGRSLVWQIQSDG